MPGEAQCSTPTNLPVTANLRTIFSEGGSNVMEPWRKGARAPPSLAQPGQREKHALFGQPQDAISGSGRPSKTIRFTDVSLPRCHMDDHI